MTAVTRISTQATEAEAEAILTHLRSRRSVSAAALTEPGPAEDALRQILTIGSRVPDHKKLAPWRFLVIKGDARRKFGEKLREVCAMAEPEASSVRLDTECGRFQRAPVVIAVVSSPVPHPAAPEWEQVLSAGAVCLNLLHASHAMGFGAQWITEWYSFDANVKAAFGLGETERFAGFVYIGTPVERPTDRDRPDIDTIVSYPDGPVR